MDDNLMIKVGKESKEWLSCVVCQHWVLTEVWGCELAHFTCEICKPQVNKRCPACRREIHLNRGISRLMKNAEFEIPCRNEAEGCNFCLTPSLMIKHLISHCLYRNIKCKFSIDCINKDKLVQLHHIQNHWKKDHKFDVLGEPTVMTANTAVTFTYCYADMREEDSMWLPKRLIYNGKVLLLFVGIHVEKDSTLFWISSLEPTEEDSGVFYNGKISAHNESKVSTMECFFQNLRANGILVHSCDQIEGKPHVSLSNDHMKQMDPCSNLKLIRDVDGFNVTITIK